MHKLHTWWLAMPDLYKGIAIATTITFISWLLTKAMPEMIRWWRTRKLRQLAKYMRAYSDVVGTVRYGAVFLEKKAFLTQLEGKIPFYLSVEDVIEFMEEKGWAQKTKPGVWRIN
jgi:hypothetical protein